MGQGLRVYTHQYMSACVCIVGALVTLRYWCIGDAHARMPACAKPLLIPSGAFVGRSA